MDARARSPTRGITSTFETFETKAPQQRGQDGFVFTAHSMSSFAAALTTPVGKAVTQINATRSLSGGEVWGAKKQDRKRGFVVVYAPSLNFSNSLRLIGRVLRASTVNVKAQSLPPCRGRTTRF